MSDEKETKSKFVKQTEKEDGEKLLEGHQYKPPVYNKGGQMYIGKLKKPDPALDLAPAPPGGDPTKRK